MHYTNAPKTRAGFIADLLHLANYLAMHPFAPVPTGRTRIYLHADSTENGGREQVNHIARLLGAAVTDDTASGGHYTAVRTFGSIDYEVGSIPATVKAWHKAQDSYRGCISPDGIPNPSALDA